MLSVWTDWIFDPCLRMKLIICIVTLFLIMSVTSVIMKEKSPSGLVKILSLAIIGIAGFALGIIKGKHNGK